jgi:hypothetical protein
VAGTLLFKEVFTATKLSSVYDCKKCTAIEKKINGCKRNKRKPVLEVECICNGANKCQYCGGIKKGNTLRTQRCPRASLLDTSISRIVPYFYRWIVSNFVEFPDGLGMYYQPKKMLDAFDILLTVYNREEAEKNKKNGS